MMIRTARLELVPATLELLRPALADARELERRLGALVPPSWPPEFLDAQALQYTIDRLNEPDAKSEWWMYFVVLAPRGEQRTLIGSAGYKGPPSFDGTVEVGYGIVSDHRRRGYATEVTRALVHRAFAEPNLRRVIAETLPELAASIGVLEKCGFRSIGGGSETGVIRFELERD